MVPALLDASGELEACLALAVSPGTPLNPVAAAALVSELAGQLRGLEALLDKSLEALREEGSVPAHMVDAARVAEEAARVRRAAEQAAASAATAASNPAEGQALRRRHDELRATAAAAVAAVKAHSLALACAAVVASQPPTVRQWRAAAADDAQATSAGSLDQLASALVSETRRLRSGGGQRPAQAQGQDASVGELAGDLAGLLAQLEAALDPSAGDAGEEGLGAVVQHLSQGIARSRACAPPQQGLLPAASVWELVLGRGGLAERDAGAAAPPLRRAEAVQTYLAEAVTVRSRLAEATQALEGLRLEHALQVPALARRASTRCLSSAPIRPPLPFLPRFRLCHTLFRCLGHHQPASQPATFCRACAPEKATCMYRGEKWVV